MAKKTLGKRLPHKQAKLLNKRVRKLTRKKLEKALEAHTDGPLSVKELHALRRLSIIRINKGETMFTWSKHDFSKKPIDEQDPSTCFCLM